MRVLLGASLVAGAFGAHHLDCTDTTNCGACATQFEECGGIPYDGMPEPTIDADKLANCGSIMNDILGIAQTAGAADATICAAAGGTYTAANATPAATYTAAVAASCTLGGPNTSQGDCEAAVPTFTEGTAEVPGSCDDGVSADQAACDTAGQTWTATVAAVANTCQDGAGNDVGDATDAAACEVAPTFTAGTDASCNNVGDETPDLADDTACVALNGPATAASCAIAEYNADLAAGTYAEGCDATKAATCAGSCTLKEDAGSAKDGSAKDGSAADDGSAASPAAMIATGMAFLALFL